MTTLRFVTLLALAGLMACGSSAATITPQRHEVAMEGMQFVPADLTVNQGDTVVWINKDIVPHTSTDSSATAGGWDSGMVNAGDSAVVVMGTKGSFDYVCIFHPVMTGKIVVQ